jgi:rhodanese-related sulfurtransferase
MPQTRRTAEDLVAEATAAIETLSVEQARTLHGRPDVTFVDVRDPRELWREGGIPGAVHAPRGMLEFWIDPASPYHRPVFASGNRFVFFCAAGWRSALATKTAQDMGLAPVCHIDGGFGAWRDAGAPVETVEPKHGGARKA